MTEIQYYFRDFGLEFFYIAMAVLVFWNISQKMVTQWEKLIFRKAIVCYILYILTDTLWYINDSNMHHWGRRGMYLIAVMYAMFHVGCNYNIFLLCMARMKYEFVLTRTRRILLMMPALLVFLLHLLPMSSSGILYYSGDYIELGEYYFVLQIISGIYMPMLFVLAAAKVKVEKNPVVRKEDRCIMIFSFFPCVCYMIEFFFTWATMKPYVLLGCIVWLFLLFQNRGLNTDFLTGLNNRVRLEMYFHEISGYFEEKSYYIFMMDMNDFKSINDNFGHVEGDRALVLTAEALRDIAGRTGCFVARYGGDEFAVIGCLEEMDPERFGRMIMAAVEEKAAGEKLPYPLTISVGYARCLKDGHTFRQLIDIADEMMYRNKKRVKESTR